VATTVYSNNAATTVTLGGTGAPASGTTETWTVSSSSSFPAASATAGTQFHVADPNAASEKITVASIAGSTWSVVRGAEGTTPVAHADGFTVVQVVTAGDYGALQAATGLTPSGDTTGVSDAAALNAAIDALIAGGVVGGALALGPGHFYVSAGVILAAQAASGVTGGQGVSLAGSGPATVLHVVGDCTGIYAHRSSNYGGQYGLAADQVVPYIRDLIIDGTYATGTGTGLDLGDGWGWNVDVTIVNFTSPYTTGLWLINRGLFNEKSRFNANLLNCQNPVILDVALPPNSDTSHEYCEHAFYLFCNAGQNGIVVQNGAWLGGGTFRVRGNFGTSASVLGAFSYTATDASPCVFTATGSAFTDGEPVILTAGTPPTGFTAATIYWATGVSGDQFSLASSLGGTALGSASTGSGTAQSATAVLTLNGSDGTGTNTHFTHVNVDIVVESNEGSANGPYTILFGSGANTIHDCWGGVAFQDTPWNVSNAAEGQFTFRGVVEGDTALNAITTPSFPTSGSPLTNSQSDVMAYISGGTITAISVGSVATGRTSGAFFLPMGQTITVTYTGSPTWAWVGTR
jgi:hypothetical protein